MWYAPIFIHAPGFFGGFFLGLAGAARMRRHFFSDLGRVVGSFGPRFQQICILLVDSLQFSVQVIRPAFDFDCASFGGGGTFGGDGEPLLIHDAWIAPPLLTRQTVFLRLPVPH